MSMAVELPTECLTTFYLRNPEFFTCPLAMASGLLIAWHQLSAVAAQSHLEPWGIGAVRYVAFSILLQFAFHGWLVTYQRTLSEKKLQPAERFVACPASAATRQTAVLLSNVLYALVPLRPASTSWGSFSLFLIGFTLAYDLYFFVMHSAFHRSAYLFKTVHRLHHRMRQPGIFSAYYVEYISHFLTEQLVVFVASAIFLPQDVLLFFLYLALFDTFIQHAGIEVDSLRVPLVPCLSVGHVRTALSFYALPLGPMSTSHHDWHHEKNGKNFALIFTYLDKLAGSYHPGRQPGGLKACAERGTLQRAVCVLYACCVRKQAFALALVPSLAHLNTKWP